MGVVAAEGDERHLREQPIGILGLYTYSLFAICLFDFCNRDEQKAGVSGLEESEEL